MGRTRWGATHPYALLPPSDHAPSCLFSAQATGCSDSKAEEMIRKLSDSGRYLKDVW